MKNTTTRSLLLLIVAALVAACNHTVTAPDMSGFPDCQLIGITTIHRPSGVIDTIGKAYYKTAFCKIPS